MSTHNVTARIEAARSTVWERLTGDPALERLDPVVTKAYAVNSIPHPDRACRLSFSSDAASELLGRGNLSPLGLVVRIGVTGDESAATVTVTASYQEPRRLAGRLFDRVVRSRQIDRALRTLVSDVAGRVLDGAVDAPTRALAFSRVVYEAV